LFLSQNYISRFKTQINYNYNIEDIIAKSIENLSLDLVWVDWMEQPNGSCIKTKICDLPPNAVQAAFFLDIVPQEKDFRFFSRAVHFLLILPNRKKKVRKKNQIESLKLNFFILIFLTFLLDPYFDSRIQFKIIN